MAAELTHGQWVKQIVVRILVGLILASALVYFGDWAVWRVRVGRGGGMGKATVSVFVVAPLKGNKEEYYYNGKSEVDCSKSIFPQGANGACWWVVRHPVEFER
jgi:hypothetical protein